LGDDAAGFLSPNRDSRARAPLPAFPVGAESGCMQKRELGRRHYCFVSCSTMRIRKRKKKKWKKVEIQLP
jgi:hypothetical protein